MNRPSGLLLACLAALPATQAPAQGFDRLGVPVSGVTELLANPAAPVAGGFLVRASVAEPFVAAGIREQRLYAHWVGARLGAAMHLDRQGSEVHGRTTLGAALQLHGALGVWGLATALQQWSFVDEFTRQRWQARIAWGRVLGQDATLSLQLRPQLTADDRLAVELLMSSSHLSPFHLLFREQRVAGFPVARQFGVIWGDTNVSLSAGYNDATLATSIGIALSTGSWRWDASATAHPFLGYGRQWGLALAR